MQGNCILANELRALAHKQRKQGKLLRGKIRYQFSVPINRELFFFQPNIPETDNPALPPNPAHYGFDNGTRLIEAAFQNKGIRLAGTIRLHFLAIFATYYYYRNPDKHFRRTNFPAKCLSV